MFILVTPHLRVGSVLELEAVHLRSMGIDGLLLDLDCTLKDYGADGFQAEIVTWVAGLRDAGFRLCILSNGRPARVGPLARYLGVPFVAKAFKPLPFSCRAALGQLGLPGARVALVGDQLFADVLTGRLAGLFTILVHPANPDEPWFTRLKRPLERWFLRRIDGGRIAVACTPTPPRAGGDTP